MYHIYDCNGQKVGNPKGYRTSRGAYRVVYNWNVKGSVRAQLQASSGGEFPVYSIKWED